MNSHSIYAKIKDVSAIADALSALLKKRMSEGEETELVKLQTRKTKQWSISSPEELADALDARSMIFRNASS